MIIALPSLLMGAILGAILGIAMLLGKVPGKLVWLKSGVTPIINVWSDGLAEIIEGTKKAKSGLIFNLGSNNEIVDPAVTPEVKPSIRLSGRRVLIRWKGSSLTNAVGEVASIDAVLNHVQNNRDEYPLLSKFLGAKEFWIMGAISHDAITVRELYTRYCIPNKTYIDEDGNEKEYSKTELKKAQDDRLNEYMAEVEKLKSNLKYVPAREAFIDVARAVAATMVPINAFILKSYRREIEASVKSKNDGWDIGTLAIGALCGFAGGIILAKVLGI
jgi:hypothetical protein